MSSSSEESSESESEAKSAPKVNGKVSMAPFATEYVVHLDAGQGSCCTGKIYLCEGEWQGEEGVVVVVQ